MKLLLQHFTVSGETDHLCMRVRVNVGGHHNSSLAKQHMQPITIDSNIGTVTKLIL